jgi:ion channel
MRVRRAVACAFAALTAAALIAPFAIGRTSPPAWAPITAAAVLSAIGYRYSGWWLGVFYGSAASAGLILIGSISPTRALSGHASLAAILRASIAAGALVATLLLVPAALSDAFGITRTRLSTVDLRTTLKVALAGGLAVALYVFVRYDVETGRIALTTAPLGIAAIVGAGFAIGTAVIALTAFPAMDAAASALRVTATVLTYLVDYFLTRAVVLAAFVFGYILTAAWFARWFWLIWRADPRSFGGQLGESPTYADFLYLSVVTIGTLGYGDIVPVSALARAAVTLELFTGVLWTTIVLAGIVAIGSERFRDG